MTKRFLCILFASGLLMQGTSPTIRLSPTLQLKEYDTSGAIAVGTSTEDVFATDIYLTFVRLTNTTAGDLTVTVADKAGTPVHLLSAVPLAAKTTFVIWLDKSWMPGGVTWVASGAGVVGYMRGLK